MSFVQMHQRTPGMSESRSFVLCRDDVADVVLQALLQHLTVNTTLLVLDAITSNSAICIPVAPIIQACKAKYVSI
jgi:selenocysteine lyase/cysteine desulfurase